MARHKPAPKGFRWVFAKKIHHKNGKILHAKHYEKKAFCFLIPDK